MDKIEPSQWCTTPKWDQMRVWNGELSAVPRSKTDPTLGCPNKSFRDFVFRKMHQKIDYAVKWFQKFSWMPIEQTLVPKSPKFYKILKSQPEEYSDIRSADLDARLQWHSQRDKGTEIHGYDQQRKLCFCVSRSRCCWVARPLLVPNEYDLPPLSAWEWRKFN